MEYFVFKPMLFNSCSLYNHNVDFRLTRISKNYDINFLNFTVSSVFINIGNDLYIEVEQYESSRKHIMDIVNILRIKSFKNGVAEFEVCKPDLNIEMYDTNKFTSMFIRTFDDVVYNPSKIENGIKKLAVEPCERFIIECDKDNLITLIKYKFNHIENKISDIKSIFYSPRDVNFINTPLIKFNIINGEKIFESIYYERYNMFISKSSFSLEKYNIEYLFDTIFEEGNIKFYPAFYLNKEDKIKILHPSNFKCIKCYELFKNNPEYFKDLLKNYIDKIKITTSFKKLKKSGIFELYLNLDKTDNIDDIINLFKSIKNL